MTDREEFEKCWLELMAGKPIEHEDFESFTEALLFKIWQARGELDAVRIKELEAKLDKAREALTIRGNARELDK